MAAPFGKVVWIDTGHYFKRVNHVELCGQVIDFMEQGLCARGRQQMILLSR